MEIKAILNKPCTDIQKSDFIVENNHRLGYEIRETETEYQAWGLTAEEEAEKREAEFKQTFFNIEGYGYYRRQPKGYQSAVESMGVLFNTALAMNGVPENIIIFYQEPDFTKPEECTEEWLIEHQIIMPALTKEQFFALWSAFTIAWNTEEHE